MVDDFLSMNDLSAAEMGALLDTADAYREGLDDDKPLAGKSVAMLFEKASLRTKVSFDIAVYELGGHPIYLGRDEVNLDVREPIEDVAGVLERWASVIVARVYAHESLVRLAARSSAPVVNALSDVEHPCQAAADLLTIRNRLGRLDGIKVAYVGDANNCALSLGLGCAAMGARFAIASPRAYAFGRDALASIAARGNAPFETEDPIAAVSGADVVYNRHVDQHGSGARKPRSAARHSRAIRSTRPCWPTQTRERCSCTPCPCTTAKRPRRACSIIPNPLPTTRRRTGCPRRRPSCVS